INAYSGTTGIVAVTGSSGNNSIDLINNSGKNIKITDFSASNAASNPSVSSSALVAGNGSGLTTENIVSIDVTGNPNSNTGGKTVTLFDGDARPNNYAGSAESKGKYTDLNSTIVGGEITFNSVGGVTVSSSVSGSNKRFSVFSSNAGTGTAASLNSVNQIDISSVSGAQNALNVIDKALEQINLERSRVGGFQSALETNLKFLNSKSLAMNTALSRVQDADYAADTANLIRQQIILQSGTAVLAQANMFGRLVLGLLNGSLGANSL
ncbi:MAG: flagellin, partial [Gammaproteobacteria bacterium]